MFGFSFDRKGDVKMRKDFDNIFLNYMNDQLVNIADYLEKSENKKKNLKNIKRIWNSSKRICSACYRHGITEPVNIFSDLPNNTETK